MAEVLRVDKTAQIVSSGSDFFCEHAHLAHDGNATLHLYSGNSTDQGKVLVAALGCLAHASDDCVINYNFRNGIYAEMTTTGTGFGAGMVYQR